MNDLLAYFIYVVAWFAVSLVCHEFGHYAAAKHQGYKPTVRFKRGFAVNVEDVVEESDDDKSILAGGVFAGFVPTMLTMVFVNFQFGFLLGVFWFIGNWREIKILKNWLGDEK